MITATDILETLVKYVKIGPHDHLVVRQEEYGRNLTVYFWDKPSESKTFPYNLTMNELKSRMADFAESIEVSHSNL